MNPTSPSQSNSPDIWLTNFPQPQHDAHKYHRGHAVIFAAPQLTGATRLASTACNRIGAGLVSVVAGNNGDLLRTCLPPDIMVRDVLPQKSTCHLSGPGGINPRYKEILLRNEDDVIRIFDADGLPGRDEFSHLDNRTILTPHQGEFERMFGKIDSNESDSRHDAALKAAQTSGALIVLKGPDTIIADPSGRCVTSSHSSPYLAKAGTGDVLAGMIAGLTAQKMPLFEACCAAAWIHGEAGIRLGPGLVASDIETVIPQILRDLLNAPSQA